MVFEKIQQLGGSDGYEQVVFCSDPRVGLKAIISMHSTALGPATGGCRMWAYKNEEEALVDVLRLSKGMTYKNSISGLNWGGGKAVIIGDSKTQKTPAMLQRYGEFVQRLGGHYITAKDVGIGAEDLKIVKIQNQARLGHRRRARLQRRSFARDGVGRLQRNSRLREIRLGHEFAQGSHDCDAGPGKRLLLHARAFNGRRRQSDRLRHRSVRDRARDPEVQYRNRFSGQYLRCSLRHLRAQCSRRDGQLARHSLGSRRRSSPVLRTISSPRRMTGLKS